MWLKKAQGGCSIAGYEWPEDGSVAEVPDDLGASLLGIPGNDFTKADGPAEGGSGSGAEEQPPAGQGDGTGSEDPPSSQDGSSGGEDPPEDPAGSHGQDAPGPARKRTQAARRPAGKTGA